MIDTGIPAEASAPPLSPRQLAIRHELRTPIGHVIGYSEMILEEVDGTRHAGITADLNSVRSGGLQLLALVDEFFNPESPSRRKLSVSQIYYELRTTVDQIIGYTELLQEEVFESGLTALLQDLDNIHRAAHHWLRLTEAYLIPNQATPPDSPNADALPASVALRLGMSAAAAIPKHLATTAGSVLIVDDNATNREMLSRRLRKWGFSVTVAKSGLQALELVRQEPFDLILLDFVMPGPNGLEVLERLKSDSAVRDIPVLMVSALGDLDGIVQCIQNGAEDYIAKPFNAVFLSARIGAALEKKRLRDKEKVYIGQIEQARADADAASRAKSTFLSIMSHEIRTPMNAILGYAQLMLRDPGLGADAKANLRIIGRSGEHLLALINDVLDISRIEAGHTDLNPATFNLPRLMGDLAAMFRLRAESRDLRFEMLLDGESVPYVVADEGRIRQALINLLGNAIKFTSRGRIRLHVTLKQRIADRLWLSARVEDTGCGISEEDQGKLFEPFSQAKGVLNSRQEGTGLGLAITRKCARLMGGDVTVSSYCGKGSIFRFEIPIERGDSGAAVRRIVPRRVIGLRAGTEVPRILVVDDQTVNRDLLMKLLTLIGFSVRGADNGEAGIRNWEEWDPQLILMDVHMPVMDGLEATRRIKADPRGKETVIVTLTASALGDDRQTASQSGADDFLTTPCREDELLSKIGALLNIAYDYEEMSEDDEGGPPAGVPSLSVESLSAEGLAQLPLALLEELRNATFSGNIRRLGELILQVRETAGAGSAHALQELVDKYEYDALVRLLEEASRR